MPLIFACTKEELFVEGEELVLDMSVSMDDVQPIATRAMEANVTDTLPLWLVVFDSNGYLVEWAKAYSFTQTTDENNEVITRFKARLHATLEGRVVHFLLNYVDNDSVLEFNYGHENNIIGGLTVEHDRGVYWQRVELPNGINNNEDNATNTVKNYLTEVPLVRNFSRITVTAENADNLELLGFYVLNVPKYGAVAPFNSSTGRFVKYFNEENPQFNGTKTFTTKSYEQLDKVEGYRGTIPNVDDVRINRDVDFVEGTTQLLAPMVGDKNNAYYIYENTYIKGNKDRTVSLLVKGNYKYNENGSDKSKVCWYRIDLVKENSVGILEYFDVLRNFSYKINIQHAVEGKSTAREAIEDAAGNNVLSSLDIAHLTEISDGIATLEVNHTDTVLVSRDVVYVRYKFTDKGNKADFTNNTNENIANNYVTDPNDPNITAKDDCGWYLTHTGAGEIPINVSFADNDETTGKWDDWRTITVTIDEEALKEREEASLTIYVKTSAGTVLSRTVSYTLLPQQKMLVECPSKVPKVVGSPVDVNILIPDGLPEAMFPLEFAIEAQGTDQSGTSKDFLVQHISPDNSEVMTVKTGGSIVEVEGKNFKGKKSFQYMVTFSYEDYLAATTTTRQLNGVNVEMRVFTKKFITNIAESASRVYAYNKYFDLGSDNFINGTIVDFKVSFSYDETATYGVGRAIKLNITAGEAGKYLIESNTLQSPTRAVLAELNMTANQSQTIDLVTSTFANQGKVLVTCKATGEMKEIFAAERNKLDAKAVSKYNGEELTENPQLNVSESEDDALSGEGSASVTVTALKNRTTITVPNIESEDDILYFSYINGNKIYIASATAGDLIAGTAALEFEEREIVVSITDLALSGSQYYGENRDVTLTFNTNIAGTYTITYKEGNTTYTINDIDGSVGANTVPFKTKTWSGQFTDVIVSTTIGGKTYSSNAINGGNRNVIDFGVLTMRTRDRWGNYNEISSTAQVDIKSSRNGNTIKTVSYSELKSGNYILELNNVAENASLYFTYNNSTKSATVKNIMTGTTIDF